MAHETVYFSRPRTYGKGARGWYVLEPRTFDPVEGMDAALYARLGAGKEGAP